MNLPKSWFNHKVIYKEQSQTIDDWDEVTQSERLITGVRMSSARQSINITVQGHSDTSKATLFLHPIYSSYVDLKENQTIIYEGQEYRIQSIKVLKWHDRDAIHHWEVELV